MNIRRATKADLSAVQSLNYHLFEHDYRFDPLLNMQWTYSTEGTDYFTKRVTGEEGICFVAEYEGEIIGYLAGGICKPYGYRNVRKQTELENILVDESFRKQGIGEKLFAAFIKWSNTQDAERIKVSAAAQNSGAIAFYQHVGFVPYAAELEYEL